MTPSLSHQERGAGIDTGATRGETPDTSSVLAPSAIADDGAAIVVAEPSGRTTRFFWDVQPTRSMIGAMPSVRDVLILRKAAESDSAAALYGACHDALPRTARRPGNLAVIDASTPGQIRLLRDGWAFLFASPRSDDDAWLAGCAAFVEAGYALHDALCLALAQLVAGVSYPRATETNPAVQESPAALARLASDVGALPHTSPPLAAFPAVYAPWRIPGRPVEEGAAESAFDETASVTLLAATGGDAPVDDHAGVSVAGNGADVDVAASSNDSGVPPTFPRCADALGLYPIAPNADWVARLIDAGVRTIQLRIKTAVSPAVADPSAELAALRTDIHRAVAYCRRAPQPVQLFINDHWRLAIEAGAYGVHLGQEDLAALPDFALEAIASAGLRLGLSTHGYYEMLLALRFRPSYIACGPIFATTTKAVAAPPQGLHRLAAYCRVLRDAEPRVPVVAIGGIGLAQVPAVRAAGAASAAVVSALVNPTNETDRNALRRGVSALQVAFNG